MNKKEILNVMKEVIVRTQGADESYVTYDAHLKDDIGMDSLDVVEFGMEMEREYNIAIPDEMWETLHNYTIDQVINYILKYKRVINKK